MTYALISVLAAAVGLELAFIRSWLRAEGRRQERWQHVHDLRQERCQEDIYWALWRGDVFERAMAATILRGDTALLRDLGIEFAVARRHLEVVA